MTLKNKLCKLALRLILGAICIFIVQMAFGIKFLYSTEFVLTFVMGVYYGVVDCLISDYIRQKVEYKQWLKDLKNERT